MLRTVILEAWRVQRMVRRATMSSLGFWGYLFGGFVVTVIVIPLLIIALLVMIPARALVAVKRTLSQARRARSL